MPNLARIVLDMAQRKLFIDGSEFPWYVSEDGIEVHDLMASNELPSITLRILADSIEVIPADG